ncbi:MAG: TolC family protein [Gemmatimonadales bacterium]
MVAALALGAAPLAAQKPVITLDDAITRSELVQPLVVSARGSVTTAAARQRAALGAFLPNLTANGSIGDFYSEGQRIDPSTGQLVVSGTTNRSVNTSVSSSIELFAGFRRTSERRAAGASRTAADAGLDNARFQQRLVTTNQFFDVLAAGELVRVREAGVRRARQQLETSIARLRAGAAIRPDSLRSVVTLGTEQLNMLTAQTQLATAEANLGRLVGAEGPVGAVADSSHYRILETVDTAALRAEALQNSPSVRAADAQAVAARAAVGVARAAYFPSLTLSGQNSYNGSRANDYNFLQQRQFTLSMSWPIFNRFQREQTIASNRVAADNAAATASEERRQVLADLTSAIAALESARLRIGITQTSVLAGQEDLRVQQERYRLGAATIVDVLTSQEALSQAEVDAVNARYDYLRAKTQIAALIGRSL